jgi:hypothetical protein
MGKMKTALNSFGVTQKQRCSRVAIDFHLIEVRLKLSTADPQGLGRMLASNNALLQPDTLTGQLPDLGMQCSDLCNRSALALSKLLNFGPRSNLCRDCLLQLVSTDAHCSEFGFLRAELDLHIFCHTSSLGRFGLSSSNALTQGDNLVAGGVMFGLDRRDV